jgi:hypothetical protein
MVGPWGELLLFLAAATTEVEEDMTSMSGPLRVLAEVRQQPPPKLKKTSMAAPKRCCWYFRQ